MIDDRLIDHITAARWFGGKGRAARVIGVSPLPWLRKPGDWPAVRQEIAEIGYPSQSDRARADHEFYQLLISYRPDDGGEAITTTTDPDFGPLIGTDGTDDPAAHDALLRFLLSGTAEHGALVAHRVPGQPLTPGLPSRVFGGEQSNTSILYAHLAIMKIFRRLEIGRNLDIETHDVLTSNQNTDVAKLYGWIEGSWDSADGSVGYGADLAMITELLPDARDGWEYAVSELRAGRDFALEARRLGGALATVHTVLRAHFRTDVVPGAEIATIMNDRLDAAIEAAPQLMPYASGLRAGFDALAGRRLPVQRVHGDFHLGQTLHTPVGWKIIDFEGEPAKTLAERSLPDHVARDLAGALRSFDYTGGHQPSDAARAWVAGCQQAFLDGYRASSDVDDLDQILPAYVADKAVYEVVYEARNRPDWIEIPLSAVAEITRRNN